MADMNVPQDPAQLEQWLSTSEDKVVGLKPGCAKHLVWHENNPVRAPLSVLYVHGFSATRHEISPVPEDVAVALNAPLFSTRLTGHGQDGAALAAARYSDWRGDLDEAFQVAAVMGHKVLVMACSTGCTLVTAALGEKTVPCDVIGVTFISPNFGMRSCAAQLLLDAPGSRVWGPWITGREAPVPVRSSEHEAYWTTKFPAKAVFSADDAVRAALACDLSHVQQPAFFAFCENDEVVNPKRSHEIIARWGGIVTHREMVMGPGDDPMGHLVAGEIHSPDQTDALTKDILNWFDNLGQ